MVERRITTHHGGGLLYKKRRFISMGGDECEACVRSVMHACMQRPYLYIFVQVSGPSCCPGVSGTLACMSVACYQLASWPGRMPDSAIHQQQLHVAW